ncbi:winged helix-turn-helix domain-containing protein [Embleya scabrispora]|uniref:winged helix-turn-helix domain-containing protein n=1 Tax=Embleya scabrispora TaxID=159449 RepID=UPI0003A5BADB|nr:helix-turn-helix domain-containing protein [Embleya scabrispora]
MNDSSRRMDARSLRALAHPLRMRLLELLRLDGPATATHLAARVGDSTGTVSWHLRHLAEHGFIEDVPERGTRRERWWQAVVRPRDLHTSEFRNDPESRGALDVYLREFLRQQGERMVESFADADAMGPEWVRARTVSDWSGVRLTADQLAELSRRVIELVNEAVRQPEQPGAPTIVLQFQAFPRRPEENSG